MSEPAPLSEAALRRLREAAAAPDADAELAELVRALAAFEARRTADAAAAAKARTAQLLPAAQPPTRARVVGRRVGMALVIGALASTSAIALARSGGPRPGAGTGTPTRKVVLTDSPSGRDTTAPRSGSSTSPRTGPTSPTPRTTPSSSPAASGTSTSAGVPVGTATGSPAPAGSPSASDSSSASGKPALVALCKRYARGNLPLKSAGYAKLVAAAGGADQIPAYCAALTSATSTSNGASSLSQQQTP